MGRVEFFSPGSLAAYARRRLIVRAHVRSADVGDAKILVACCKGDEMEIVVWEENKHVNVQRFTPAAAGGEACLRILGSFCHLGSSKCREMLHWHVESSGVRHVSDPLPREISMSALYLLPVYGQIKEQLRIMRQCSSQGDDSCLSLLQMRLDAFIRSRVSGPIEFLSDLAG